MGASNAIAAYMLYAGRVPPTAFKVLVYMALVALDHDSEPQFWQGHEALAMRCFGIHEQAVDASALRAVRRAITPLFEAGAITVVRHSSGHGSKYITVRYRLWLVTPAPDENRPAHHQFVGRYRDMSVVPSDWPAPDENRPKPSTGVGRRPDVRGTESDHAPDENRPPKEKEEDKEREEKQEKTSVVDRGTGIARESADEHDDFEARRQCEMNRLAEWIRDHPETDSS